MQPGHRIGLYTLVTLLGHGRVGRVWRAKKTPASPETAAEVETEVALKVALPGQSARLAHERDMLRRIDSPHVNPPIAAADATAAADVAGEVDAEGATAKPAWLAFPLLIGHSLRHRLEAEGPMLPAALVPILDAVWSALAQIHAAGVVHADLKPDHVWIDSATGRVWIIDFSHARLAPTIGTAGFASDANTADAADAGVVAGSPAYMAPEMRAGAPPTPAVDVYAVGTTVFECLTGRLPMGDELPSGVGDFPWWCDALYAKCCCASLDTRFSTGAAGQTWFAAHVLAPKSDDSPSGPTPSAAAEPLPIPSAATFAPPLQPRLPLAVHLRARPSTPSTG